MSKGLQVSLIGMGLFFILLGIFLNFQLYTSLTDDSSLHKYSYGFIGIGLDISKVICLLLGAYLLRQVAGALILAGFVSIAFYFVLSLISWAAGWGFTLVVTQNYENQAFQRNRQVQAAQVSIEDANTEVKRLSQYANSAMVNQSQLQLSEIQAQIDAIWASPAKNSLNQRTGKTVQAQLGGVCPGTTWYHRKYCPQIQSLDSQIKENQTIVDNYTTYLAAVKHKNAMIKELGNMELTGVNPNSYMHPLFIGMGTIFNASPQLVKYRLLLLTSLMIELLGSLFFVIGLLLKGQAYTMTDILAMEKQKQQLLTDLGVKIIDVKRSEYSKLPLSYSETISEKKENEA